MIGILDRHKEENEQRDAKVPEATKPVKVPPPVAAPEESQESGCMVHPELRPYKAPTQPHQKIIIE